MVASNVDVVSLQETPMTSLTRPQRRTAAILTAIAALFSLFIVPAAPASAGTGHSDASVIRTGTAGMSFGYWYNGACQATTNFWIDSATGHDINDTFRVGYMFDRMAITQDVIWEPGPVGGSVSTAHGSSVAVFEGPAVASRRANPGTYYQGFSNSLRRIRGLARVQPTANRPFSLNTAYVTVTGGGATHVAYVWANRQRTSGTHSDIDLFFRNEGQPVFSEDTQAPGFSSGGDDSRGLMNLTPVTGANSNTEDPTARRVTRDVTGSGDILTFTNHRHWRTTGLAFDPACTDGPTQNNGLSAEQARVHGNTHFCEALRSSAFATNQTAECRNQRDQRIAAGGAPGNHIDGVDWFLDGTPNYAAPVFPSSGSMYKNHDTRPKAWKQSSPRVHFFNQIRSANGTVTAWNAEGSDTSPAVASGAPECSGGSTPGCPGTGADGGSLIGTGSEGHGGEAFRNSVWRRFNWLDISTPNDSTRIIVGRFSDPSWYSGDDRFRNFSQPLEIPIMYDPNAPWFVPAARYGGADFELIENADGSRTLRVRSQDANVDRRQGAGVQDVEAYVRPLNDSGNPIAGQPWAALNDRTTSTNITAKTPAATSSFGPMASYDHEITFNLPAHPTGGTRFEAGFIAIDRVGNRSDYFTIEVQCLGSACEDGDGGGSIPALAPIPVVDEGLFVSPNNSINIPVLNNDQNPNIGQPHCPRVDRTKDHCWLDPRYIQVNGSPVNQTSWVQTSEGRVQLSADGNSLVYQAYPWATNRDLFTYSIATGIAPGSLENPLRSNPTHPDAEVRITITNYDAIARPDGPIVVEIEQFEPGEPDYPFTITPDRTNVLANDSNTDVSTLRVVSVSDPQSPGRQASFRVEGAFLVLTDPGDEPANGSKRKQVVVEYEVCAPGYRAWLNAGTPDGHVRSSGTWTSARNNPDEYCSRTTVTWTILYIPNLRPT